MQKHEHITNWSVQRDRDSDQSDVHQAWIPHSESRGAGSCVVVKGNDVFVSTLSEGDD